MPITDFTRFPSASKMKVAMVAPFFCTCTRRFSASYARVVHPGALACSQYALIEGHLIDAAVEDVGRVDMSADGERVGGIDHPATVVG